MVLEVSQAGKRFLLQLVVNECRWSRLNLAPDDPDALMTRNFFFVPSICIVITTVDGILPWDIRFVC